jgi:hypothetical protein
MSLNDFKEMWRMGIVPIDTSNHTGFGGDQYQSVHGEIVSSLPAGLNQTEFIVRINKYIHPDALLGTFIFGYMDCNMIRYDSEERLATIKTVHGNRNFAYHERQY